MAFLIRQGVLVLGAICILSIGSAAQESHRDTTVLDVYADFRFRLESDWGTHEADGDELEGRTRARVRARIGATYAIDERVTAGMRMRSGLIGGQQVGNITIYDFDGNNTGDADFSLDKWYLEYGVGGLSVWIGRNSLPYWHQNQLYWDDDVTPAGFAATYGTPVGAGQLEFHAGLFSLPAGMHAFSGSLGLGQVVYDGDVGGVGATVAGALMAISADRDDPDRLIYLEENGDRDYTIWQASLQLESEAGRLPLRLGADLAYNSQDYGDAAAGSYTEFHRDDRLAYAVSATVGDAAKAGGWEFGYTYAYIELFAVNNSYVQDDWVRWGTAEQIRDSNFKGHGFKGALDLPWRFSATAEVFVVQGITLRTATSLQKEDGNRVRLDLHYKM